MKSYNKMGWMHEELLKQTVYKQLATITTATLTTAATTTTATSLQVNDASHASCDDVECKRVETETEQKEHNVRGATLPATVVPSRVSPQPSARHVTIKTILPGFKVTGILLSSFTRLLLLLLNAHTNTVERLHNSRCFVLDLHDDIPALNTFSNGAKF